MTNCRFLSALLVWFLIVLLAAPVADAATCGDTFVDPGEQCDDGADNGTDLCCSVTCQRIDADSDGVCDRDDNCPNSANPSQSDLDGDVVGDACDICPGDVDNDSDDDLSCMGVLFNPPAKSGDDLCSRPNAAGVWLKPKVLFGKVGSPAGDDIMRLKGSFSVGSLQPQIQPNVYGVHVRVTDKNGRLMVDERIPGSSGLLSPLQTWKTTGSPPQQWVYVDRGKPAGSNGISKVTIKQRATIDPSLFAVAVQGNRGTYPVQPGEEPVRVAFELNDQAFPPGSAPGRDQCGEVRFLENAAPSCRFVKFKLSCK